MMIHIKDDVGCLVIRAVVLDFRKNVLSGILFKCLWCSWCYGIYQRSSIYNEYVRLWLCLWKRHFGL